MKKSIYLLTVLILAFSWYQIRHSFNQADNITNASIIHVNSLHEMFKGFKLLGQSKPYGNIYGDQLYVLPEEQWLRTKFIEGFRRYKKLNGLDKYSSERNDCDDYARSTIQYLNLIHNKTFKVNAAICVGEFWYIPERNNAKTQALSGHCINIFLARSSTTEGVVLFFDAQLEEFIELTDKEILSCIVLKI